MLLTEQALKVAPVRLWGEVFRFIRFLAAFDRGQVGMGLCDSLQKHLELEKWR
jgi:hypothetical protein